MERRPELRIIFTVLLNYYPRTFQKIKVADGLNKICLTENFINNSCAIGQLIIKRK